MQKQLFFVVLLLSSFVFMQCKSGGGGGNSPESVSMRFLKYFAAFEFDKVKKLCTEDANKVIDFLESMLGMVSEEERAEFRSKTAEDMKSLKKTTCRIDGERAFCRLCCDAEGNSTPDEPIRLRKVEGKWLVDMSKEDLNMGGN